MAGLAALATNPTLWNDNVLTKTKNEANIYAFKFYIRGKPWVVSVDSNLLFQNSNNPYLVFAQLDEAGIAVWGPLYEKAWAKVKGSIDLAEGGYAETSLRAMTGAPVFRTALTTVSDTTGINNIWSEIKTSL